MVAIIDEALEGDAVPAKLAKQIARKSDGVPFFVLEMARGLKQALDRRQEIAEIEVPSAVRDVIGGRLASLEEEDRALLAIAAVLGVEFDPDLVARVGDQKAIRVFQRLAVLERRTGIVRSAGPRFRFDHSQMQEILYLDLHERLREEYHAALADAFAERERVEGTEASAVGV